MASRTTNPTGGLDRARPQRSRQPIGPDFRRRRTMFHKRSLSGIREQFSVTWTTHIPKLMSNIDGSLYGLSTSCETPSLVRYAQVADCNSRKLFGTVKPVRWNAGGRWSQTILTMLR